MLLITLLVIQVSRSLSYDIEIEGKVHFDKDLVRSLLNNNKPEEHQKWIDESLLQLMAVEPILRSNNKQDADNEAVDARIKATALNNDVDFEMAPTENPEKLISVKFQFNLFHEMTTNGSLIIQRLAYFIKNHLNPGLDMNAALKTSTNDYSKEMNSYYVFISKKSIKCEIDKELVVLDIIETTNKILFQQANKLLNDIIEIIKPDISQTNTTMLVEHIKKTVLEEKRELLKYVCKELKVCRSFPGYCDRIADMLSELLQLTDKNFDVIIITLNETITLKREFFETIMRDNVYNKLSKNLTKAISNTKYLRQVFSIIRSEITERFKVFEDDSPMIKVETKAVRILLDLIDKAFEINDNDINFIDIENTISCYKQWAVGDRDDVGMITKKFVYNAIEILNYYWSKETKEEIKVLTDVIFSGGTENLGMFEYLFTHGSLFFRELI